MNGARRRGVLGFGVARSLHLRDARVSMRSILIISCAVLTAVACGGYGNKAGTTTITGAPMITSGPAVGERELPRTLASTSEAIARGVCEHEKHCGRTDRDCVDATVKKARTELTHWNCEPAATRARLEECLVGFQSEACETNLQARKEPLCPSNEVCPGVKLIDPEPALEKIMER